MAICSREASRLLSGQAAAEEAVLLRTPLITSGPEVEQDERHEHVEGDVEIADMQVGAADEDERKDDSAEGRDAADEPAAMPGRSGNRSGTRANVPPVPKEMKIPSAIRVATDSGNEP